MSRRNGNLMFCSLAPRRWAPAKGCTCGNCVARRVYKREKQRIYQALHGHRWVASDYRYQRRRYEKLRRDPEWRLATTLYNELRRLMMRDGAWPARGN